MLKKDAFIDTIIKKSFLQNDFSWEILSGNNALKTCLKNDILTSCNMLTGI